MFDTENNFADSVDFDTPDIIVKNEKYKRKDRRIKHRRDRFEHDDHRWDGFA